MKYSCVYEVENLGIGVAPWNLHLYSCEGKKGSRIWLCYRGEKFPLIFYHFEGMKYLDDGKIFLNLWEYSVPGTNRKVKLIYDEYFRTLQFFREKLKDQYGLSFEHMIADKGEFLGKNYSLKRYCMDCGLAGGLKIWLSFRINNLRRV